MEEHTPSIPKRYTIARRFQYPSAFACALFILSCFVGWPLGVFWPSVVGLVFFVPSAFLLSINCYRCGYPAFSDFQADERLRKDESFWSNFWGKDYRNVRLPLKPSCSKCGTAFELEV